MKTSLTVLKNQAGKMEIVLAIKTKNDMVIAVNHLGKVKSFLKEVQAKKKEVMESINFLLLPLETMEKRAKEIEKEIKAQMISYQTLTEEKAKAKIKNIEERVEAGSLSFETGIKKMENLEPEQKIEAENSLVQFTTIKEVIVEDENKIPDEYWILDMIKIHREVMIGTVIAGVKIVEKKIVRSIVKK